MMILLDLRWLSMSKRNEDMFEKIKDLCSLRFLNYLFNFANFYLLKFIYWLSESNFNKSICPTVFAKMFTYFNNL